MASVTPAARPAIFVVEESVLNHTPIVPCICVPIKVARPLTSPVSLFAARDLYHSKDVNRIAIFGTIPVMTAPRPL